MKTILSAALVAATFSFAVPHAVTDAEAAGGRNDRTAICDYYRDKAYAASRRGHYDRADYFWHLFRACQEHRID